MIARTCAVRIERTRVRPAARQRIDPAQTNRRPYDTSGTPDLQCGQNGRAALMIDRRLMMNDVTDVQLGIRRAAEMAAVFMIGDGILGVLQPRRHVDLWQSNVPAVDLLVRPFVDRPARRRVYGLLQIGAGIALASALTRRKQASHRAK